jgi:hypothetical protein
MMKGSPFEGTTIAPLSCRDRLLSHEWPNAPERCRSRVLESLIPKIHSAACVTIDAIKPNGELNHRVKEYSSQIDAIHDG